LEQARVRYDQILKDFPRNIDALMLRATLAGQLQNFSAALDLIDRAIEVAPGDASAHNYRGLALKSLGETDASFASYRRAIELDEAHAEAHSNLGNLHRDHGRLDTALACYERAVRVRPDYAQGHYNRAVVLAELGRWPDSLAAYDRAIELNGNHAEAHSNRGTVLQALGRLQDALGSFDRAIALNARLAQAHANRGNVLRSLDRLEEALASCQRAIQLNQDFAEAHMNLGNVLTDLRRWDAALTGYDKAIALRDNFSEAHCNRGQVLYLLRRCEESVASYDRALALRADLAAAHEGRANALLGLKRYEAAIAGFDEAIAHDPRPRFMFSVRVHAKMQICDWSDWDREVDGLIAGIERGEPVCMPFALLALSDSAGLQRRAAEIWVRDGCPPTAPLPTVTRLGTRGKIRVAYYSADFFNHATLYLMAGLFEHHDRDRFEVVAISYGPAVQDEMRTRLEASGTQVIDVCHRSDAEVAALSRQLGIDIAVDLKGFTADCRPGIFALRAAPLQVNFLGYPGTMAADFIEYLIADRTLIPASSRRHYRECIAFLPDCYQVNDSTRRISNAVYCRDEFGLPPDGFVYCCFNSSYKITPAQFASWMRILARVPCSVLWLIESHQAATRHLRASAQHLGVEADRLVFARRMPPAEHLARHRLADLFLDTLPYNAHTTASDALWAGLPVLTCMGEAFAARVAGSLLCALQLPELVAHSPAEYELRAVELARDRESLAELRRRLARNRTTTSLFDTRRFTQRLEAAFQTMHGRHVANLPPQDFGVDGA
jgi:predicted O-linked N-acetylglucosamine transferase (SPINDLY family)